MVTARSSVVRTVCSGVVVCHTKGYNIASDVENCSNVSDSLPLTIDRTQELITKLKGESSTRLVLDQNSSKVHDRYTTSLYTF